MTEEIVEEKGAATEEISVDDMKVTKSVDHKKAAEEAKNEPKEDKQEAPKEVAEAPKELAEDEEVSEEEEASEKLPFPTACIVRIMKANMDPEKMIKKDVKIGMNKWLGRLCAKIAKEMNKLPYVMMHMHEFEEAKRMYEDLENFDKEKGRILAHFEAIKKDIEKLERDLGKEEEEEIKMEREPKE